MVNHGQSTSGWLPPQTLREWLGELSPSSLELDEDDELGDSSPGLVRSNTGHAGRKMRKPGTDGAEDEAGISDKQPFEMPVAPPAPPISATAAAQGRLHAEEVGASTSLAVQKAVEPELLACHGLDLYMWYAHYGQGGLGVHCSGRPVWRSSIVWEVVCYQVQCPPTLSPTRNVFDEQQACALEWKTPLWSKSWDVTGGAAT